jgi:hypothetical protein
MLQGININERIEFISKDDNSEPKTIFVLKPFSGVDMLNISQQFKDGRLILSGEEILTILEKSIVEIKNFSEAIPIKEIISRLPGTILGELITKIGIINNLTKEDQKN